LQLNEKGVVRIAGFELNALNYAKVLPVSLEGVRIEDPGTLIYDINGEPLLRRIPLERRRETIGYADVAVLDIFAEPLLAVDFNRRWDEAAMLRRACVALQRIDREAKYDETRFVAYSYPKLAVQFLLDGHEVAMLELMSWAEVPPARRRDTKGDFGFQRWSLIETAPDDTRRETGNLFEKRVAHWDTGRLRRFDPSLISTTTLEPVDVHVLFTDRLELHYAPRVADH